MEFEQKWCAPDYQPVTRDWEKTAITQLFDKHLKSGAVELIFSNTHKTIVGCGTPNFAIAPPPLKTLLRMITNPDYHVLEAFREGHWYCVRGSMSDFLFLLESQPAQSASYFTWIKDHLALKLHFYKQFMRPLHETRKTKDHYDTNRDFFRLLLGTPRAYSCAVFSGDDVDLCEAQMEKFRLLKDRGQITSDLTGNALDIGSGWGDFAHFLYNNSKMNVDGISISREQVDVSNQRFLTRRDRNLEFLCRDFVGLDFEKPEHYDRIVSVGMLEHVGKTQYRSYFSAVFGLLKPGGVAVVHSIVKHHKSISNSWVDKYIFPGGYVPQVSEVIKATEDSGLKCDAVHIIAGSNYVKTLRAWLQNLKLNDDQCAELLFGKHAVQSRSGRQHMRTWYCYLNAVQLLFLRSKRRSDVAHFVLAKPERY